MVTAIFRCLSILFFASVSLFGAEQGNERHQLNQSNRFQPARRAGDKSPTILSKAPLEAKQIAKTPPTELEPVDASTLIAAASEKAKPAEVKPVIAAAQEKPTLNPSSQAEQQPVLCKQSGGVKVPTQAESAKGHEVSLDSPPPQRLKEVVVKALPLKKPERFSLRKNPSARFALLTFPGCGRTYLETFFFQLTGKTSTPKADFQKCKGAEFCPPRMKESKDSLVSIIENFSNANQSFYPSNFFSFSYVYRHFIQEYPGTKIICVIKDLRDLAVELALTEGERIEKSLGRSASVEEKIMWIITDGFDKKRDHVFSLKAQATEALHWIRNPDVLFVRVEDLIGRNAHKPAIEQEETFSRIASFLDHDLTRRELGRLELAFNAELKLLQKKGLDLDPNWVKYFTEEHVAEFKRRLGPYLIALGYEADDNW